MQQDKQLIEKYSVIIAEFMGYEYISETNDNYENYGWWVKGTYHIDNNARNNPNFLRIGLIGNYHTDWNEIHKLKFKVINDSRFDFTDEKCLHYKGLINHCLLYKEEPFEAFMVIGKCIEYLNTIK